MKAHLEIIQGSPEWHQIRYRKIGGTSCKGLLTKTDTLLNDLVAEHLEPFVLDEDGYESSDMIRGKELEPEAVLKGSQYIGIDLIYCGWLQSETHPILGISPDAVSEDFTIACEIKCPAKEEHTRTIREDAIPLKHIHQCCHYFAVNDKLETLYFLSYRPESVKPMFVKELKRDSLVNIGTEAKPIIRSVAEVVFLIHSRAIEMEKDIKYWVDTINA